MQTINKQNDNLHTVAQIREMGNRILRNDGDGYLRTIRGKTVTEWVEKEPGLFYPFNAYVRD